MYLWRAALPVTRFLSVPSPEGFGFIGILLIELYQKKTACQVITLDLSRQSRNVRWYAGVGAG